MIWRSCRYTRASEGRAQEAGVQEAVNLVYCKEPTKGQFLGQKNVATRIIIHLANLQTGYSESCLLSSRYYKGHIT